MDGQSNGGLVKVKGERDQGGSRESLPPVKDGLHSIGPYIFTGFTGALVAYAAMMLVLFGGEGSLPYVVLMVSSWTLVVWLGYLASKYGSGKGQG